MSTFDYRVKVNKAGMEQLKALAVAASTKAIKAAGTIYVRAAASYTPPFRLDGEEYSNMRLRTQTHPDITQLRRAICKNIIGVERNWELPEAIAQEYRKLPGQWLALAPGGKSAMKLGPFGFVVPLNYRDKKGKAVPVVDPAQVFATARWDGHKMAPPQWKIRFVRKTKLEALVKRQQKQAGKLISGWAPAARVFAEGKNIAKGFFEKLGGKGFGKIYTDKKGVSRGIMINRQAYNEKLAQVMAARLNFIESRTKEARRVQIRNIAKWYQKEARGY